MRTSFHDLWGCARGPVRALAPQTRLLCGGGLLGACLLIPTDTLSGSSMVALTVAGWMAACRPPARVVRAALATGLVLFLPYFLLLPLIHVEAHGSEWRAIDAVAVVWTVLLRGVSGMLVSVTTVCSLSTSDVHQALVRLPLPSIVTDILVQMVHQTGTLIYETRRMAAAMAVRGAAGHGRTVVAVLSSLPQVWLPRVMERAERIAAAMEMREFRGGALHPQAAAMRFFDLLALALVLLWLMAAAVARYRGWG